MAPRTMDHRSSLCFIIKKEHGKYSSIINKPTTITFPFLFSPLKKQNNNNNSVFNDVTEDDRVCLHFSVGDPSCAECNYNQQQLTTNNNNNKKRKRPQQPQTLMKNKKARIINNWEEDEEEYDGTICLHLLLGSSSCIPTCCLQTNNNIVAAAYDHQWEIKKFLENSDVCRHLSRLLINKDVAQKFVIPVLLGGAEAAQTKDGIPVQVRDADTDTLVTLVYKYWSSTKNHIFTKRWVKDFVIRRDLKKGDQIGLWWDQENKRFDFSVLRRAKSDLLSMNV